MKDLLAERYHFAYNMQAFMQGAAPTECTLEGTTPE